MPLADLAAPPPAVADAAALIDRIDHAFLAGFARLSGDDVAALDSLQNTFAATPLAAALKEAVEGIGRSEFLDRHFLVLAAARAALQGAQHDALIAQACSALGRPAPELASIDAGAAQAPPPQLAVWMESTRHWLMELALAGFANLGMDTLLPFQATLDQIESEGRLTRHAALLDGFLDELLSVFPTKGAPVIPLFRWADLWSRAMVLAADAPEAVATRAISGELRILGADLRQHETFATLVAFGTLREKGKDTLRIVRATVSAFKVDVIRGEELGPLLASHGAMLLNALGGWRALAVADMPITPTNDLVWNDKAAKLGAAYNPLGEAAEALSAAPADRPCLAPADRHPALIEELVYLPDYTVTGKEADLALAAGGASFPVALDRWPDTDDLRLPELRLGTALVGLLRFDSGRWSVQPLAVGGNKKKPGVRVIGSSLAATPSKSSQGALALLKDKAGKLLRKKS